jgi:phage-related protein (TIGR01555 family)
MVTFSDGLRSFTSGLGTPRDKAATVEYVQPQRGNDTQLQAAYEGAWLPRRIVDQFAEDATRKWRAWQADPAQITLIERTEKRLDLRAKVERALILARLWGKAHIYIGVEGQDPIEPLRPESVGRDRLSNLTVMSRRELVDGDIDDDPFSAYYGTPKYYQLTSPSAGFVNVHPSRLVTFYGAERPNDMVFGREGDSVLTALWPAIMQHDSTVANVAGLVFEARVDVISVPGLDGLLSDPETERHILARFSDMARMKGNNRLVLLNSSANPDMPSETWEQKNTSFATLPDIIDRMQQQVAGAAKIPRALLFGTGAGGLGATGDLELSAYYDQIATVQSNELEPAMVILDECIIRSAFGSRPAEIWYQWNSLWQMSDKDKADIGDKIASKWQKLIASQAIPPEAATMAVINDLTEHGVGGGIEQSYQEWIEGGGMRDKEEPEDMIDAT